MIDAEKETAIKKLEVIDWTVTLRWLLEVAIDYMIIAFTMYVAITLSTWWVYLIAICIIGTQMDSLAILGHEGGHYLVSKNRPFNDILSNAFIFYPFTLCVEGYRPFHGNHHRYYGSQLDPEIIWKKKNPYAWDIPITKRRIVLVLLKDLIGFALIDIYEFSRLVWRGRNLKSVISFLIYFAALVGLFFYLFGTTTYVILALWFIPMGTIFWALFRMRIYTEHMGTPSVHRIYAPMISRMTFVPESIWYHLEHHYNDRVPFFRLKKVREIDPRPDIPVQSISDVINSYATMPPIPAGTPLRKLKDDGSEQSTL